MNTPPAAPTLAGAARSFRNWLRAMSLSEALSLAEADVRARPRSPQARWLLFELLCVLGHWVRALQQLQVWAGLAKDSDGTAHVMRGLIRAERQRSDVFAGRTTPATVVAAGDAPASTWMSGMGDALRFASQTGDAALEAGDLARETALAAAPDTPGACQPLGRFAWVCDADTRLGPVCEVVLVGAYRWLAFADLASITKSEPRSLLDLLWAQADLVLRDGTALKGYMPVRYPVREGDRDALLTGRETVWSEHGRTGLHGHGQKMWITDAGDLSLLDLRHGAFGGAALDAH